MSESEMSDNFYVAGKHGSEFGSETGEQADDEFREQTPETQDPTAYPNVYEQVSGFGLSKKMYQKWKFCPKLNFLSKIENCIEHSNFVQN